MAYKTHRACRACGLGLSSGPGGTKAASQSDKLVEVLNLGVMPLPNAFCKDGESQPGYYPISLMVCPRCTLGQLSIVVDPLVLYQKYAYVTSPSKTMAGHFNRLWDSLNSQKKIQSVIEIGSNDGLFLEFCKNSGAERVLGIDPAENLVELAKKRGIETLCGLFDKENTRIASATIPNPDLVIARHCFCHINDWQQFIANVSLLCGKETLVCIEVPYAQDLIKECQWDTIYAEHTSYLTIKAAQYLLEGSMLRLQKVQKFPIHGGAIALFLRRRDSEVWQDESVHDFLEKEKCEVEDWKKFAAKAELQILHLGTRVRDLVAAGKRVCGYGASAKSTVWISACKFTRKEIACICDATATKVYCNSPGTDIPIVHEGDHFTGCFDYVVLFAWNFSFEIMEREKTFGHKGFKWIVPVPTIQEIDA